jgi:outer membrane immunogenic protein
MKQVLVAAVLASVASGALAADLPTAKGAPQSPTYFAPPPFTWTGFYLGVNGGWSWGDLSSSNFTAGNSGLIGGTVGYNMQLNQFVLGLEADLDGTDMITTNTYGLGSNKFGTHALTTERVRAGFAIDRALLYVTGGYAGLQTTASFNDTVHNTSGWTSDWRNGGAIGAGVEYAITNNITAKAEYLYLPFSDSTYFSGTPDGETSSLSLSILRAGVNYKF